jgi:hypothetical protein
MPYMFQKSKPGAGSSPFEGTGGVGKIISQKIPIFATAQPNQTP